QFEQEAKRLASLKNKDGIVDIFDSFRANNTVYIVMECLEGETLKSLLKREKKLSVEKATNIIVAVLQALKEVHSDGIIHRDISPENIFITNTGEVKLIDFGAARNATTGLSKSLSVIVKQGYAPPEQYFSKGKQGSWTDVYATAATYYKMLTGITPDDSMERKGKDTLVPPSKLRVKLSKKQENALLNALELNVKDRTATVGEFLKGITDTKIKVKRTKVKKEKVDLGKMSLKTKFAIVLGAAAVVGAFIIGYQVVRDNLINDQEAIEESQVYVPNVLSMSYDQAIALLEEQGLNHRVISWKSLENTPSNTVVGQSIEAGQLVDKGSEIGLTVSNNSGDNVFVEDFIGMNKEDVIAQLDKLQLYGEFESVESSLVPGYIVSQSVSPNEALKRGNVIKLQVSTGLLDCGNFQVDVPELVGMQFEDCLEKLEDEKLHIMVAKIIYNKDIPKGEIISQNHKAHSRVSAGTTIEVEISGGIQMVRIPTVDFYDVRDAKQELEALGLNVEIVYYDNDISQTTVWPKASVEHGDLVEIGSTVTLYKNRGIVVTTEIIEPENINGNEYNVGEEVRVTLQISYEDFGINSGWDMELGIDYDTDILEFKGIEGKGTAEYGVSHSGCAWGDLYEGSSRKVSYYPEDDEFLTLYYSFEGEVVCETVTLVFDAKEKGETILRTFMVSTPMDNNQVWLHMWSQSPIYYNYYHTSNHNNNLGIEVK
ncbi:MAG: PASTA domain-containing protein, partial [Lachnospiraceae bacterium]|nr:PASTA domain-containing protein [Lachnospiraceae bacterium]